jgi:hypothetical protein
MLREGSMGWRSAPVGSGIVRKTHCFNYLVPYNHPPAIADQVAQKPLPRFRGYMNAIIGPDPAD